MWVEIMGTFWNVNSSNSTNVNLLKILNRCNVVHIVANTSQIPIIGSIDFLASFPILCELNKSWELHAITMQWKITMSFLSISLHISTSFEAKVKWSLLKEKTWLSLEEDFFRFLMKMKKINLGRIPLYITFMKILVYIMKFHTWMHSFEFYFLLDHSTYK